MMKWKILLAASGLMLLGFVGSAASFADSKAELDASVSKTVKQFYALSPKNKELAGKAAGMLVFPRITKAGAGIAGEYGEGVLLVDGKTVGYYSNASGSIGLTLGISDRSEVIMFMTQASLDKFTNSHGWSVGADAGFVLVSAGAGGSYDTQTLQKPILGFVFGKKGLIGDLSIEGSKITKIVKVSSNVK
ncbi:MAG: lipid-binding SYLF domain-containing protein [Sulfuricaulis sp.]